METIVKHLKQTIQPFLKFLNANELLNLINGKFTAIVILTCTIVYNSDTRHYFASANYTGLQKTSVLLRHICVLDSIDYADFKSEVRIALVRQNLKLNAKVLLKITHYC